MYVVAPVYGAEHLLRLLVKLPEPVPPTGETLGYSSNTIIKIQSWLLGCVHVSDAIMPTHVVIAVNGAEHLLHAPLRALPGAPEEQLQLLLQRMEHLLVYLQHHVLCPLTPP
jgi:hypothetical protein